MVALEGDLSTFQDFWAFGIEGIVKDLGSKSESPNSSTDPVLSSVSGVANSGSYNSLTSIESVSKLSLSKSTDSTSLMAPLT